MTFSIKKLCLLRGRRHRDTKSILVRESTRGFTSLAGQFCPSQSIQVNYRLSKSTGFENELVLSSNDTILNVIRTEKPCKCVYSQVIKKPTTTRTGGPLSPAVIINTIVKVRDAPHLEHHPDTMSDSSPRHRSQYGTTAKILLATEENGNREP